MNAINVKNNQWLVTVDNVEYTVFCAENANTEQDAIKLVAEKTEGEAE